MMPVSQPVSFVSTSAPLVPVARSLPLVGMRVTTDACNGLARVVVEQRFRNPHDVPLSVTYALPLPADAAVSAFSFVIGERRIEGDIAGRQEARERFEDALLEGKSAALLEQDRSSLFLQEIGNIPPGADVVAVIVLDQPLRWLDEGAWEWRFPTAAAPRYLGSPGAVADAGRVRIDVADGPIPARATLVLSVRDPFKDGVRIESPSHALQVTASGDGQNITLAEPGGVPLDRDLVVRWRVVSLAAGFTVDLGRAAAASPVGGDSFALCTIVPPAKAATARHVPRDLIVLLDTSGSMGGEPLAQAQRVVSALIDTLNDRDQLELIEFSTRPRRWKSKPVMANATQRHEALAWVASLSAAGGTEMRSGITEAMATLRPDSQRQIVLVTDGQIGFEAQVVAELTERLPRGTRLHSVGVGSAVNRSLTGPAARAGRGIEVIVGLGEDPERAAARLVARTASPLVVDVTLSGSALLEQAPARVSDLFAGAPLLVSARVASLGGELVVRGRTADGPWEATLVIPALEHGAGTQSVVTLFGREKAEDLELAAAAQPSSSLDPSIERVGLDFKIATRLTSWVAVSDTPFVDPRGVTRRERVPQALPYGMSIEGLGLRAVTPSAFGGTAPASARSRAVVPLGPSSGGRFGSPPPPPVRAMAPAPAPAAAPRRPAVVPFRGRDEARASESLATRGDAGGDRSTLELFLDGRVTSWRPNAAVVELTAGSDGFAWDPDQGSGYALITSTGARLPVTLDVDHVTSLAAIMRPGDSVRLSLVLGVTGLPVGDVVALTFEMNGQSVTVKLAA
jgi:Ca-activated chloride channel family protein